MDDKITVTLDPREIDRWEGTLLGKTERLLFRRLWEYILCENWDGVGQVAMYLKKLTII